MCTTTLKNEYNRRLSSQWWSHFISINLVFTLHVIDEGNPLLVSSSSQCAFMTRALLSSRNLVESCLRLLTFQWLKQQSRRWQKSIAKYVTLTYMVKCCHQSQHIFIYYNPENEYHSKCWRLSHTNCFTNQRGKKAFWKEAILANHDLQNVIKAHICLN